MPITPTPNFVAWFRSVAPYINAFRGKTFVIAFGGEVVADPEAEVVGVGGDVVADDAAFTDPRASHHHRPPLGRNRGKLRIEITA